MLYWSSSFNWFGARKLKFELQLFGIRFNPNSATGLRVAATPRRRNVLATPSSPVGRRLSQRLKKCDERVAVTGGDEASPLPAPCNFGFRVQ
jgi:hypothetical protein